MTAISGTTSAWRSGWNTRTVSSIPGRSLRSGLGSTARTVTARVTGSTRESSVATSPLNSSPG